ncbi:glutathione transferase GstA [Polaromonas sp.]|uniref:glutathione transferase GstA n=1 Tax=Polaromonas sp. TaxID=1869339 RepID=UPI0024877103|nr:glutathione transferase GstA [Polaromonas sp.]MDI1273864.1 glutathione transferase GstA [Polaromonas sp.]
MKLYYTPGACSQAVHIACREAGLAPQLIRVDLAGRCTGSGEDFDQINPRGYVPVLELDDGSRHTEAAALLQWVGENHHLLPAHGSPARLEALEWLAFIATELHKGFGPLFNPAIDATTREAVVVKLLRRFGTVERHLAQRDWLAGHGFSVVDAYAFTILGWGQFFRMDLSPFPRVQAYLQRIAQRPAVQAALKAEGLVLA